MLVFAQRAVEKSPREVELRVVLLDDDSAFVVYDAAPPLDSLPPPGDPLPPLPPRERGRGEGLSDEPVADSPGYLAYWMNYQTGEFFVFGRRLYDRRDVGHALRNLRRDLDADPSGLLQVDSDLERALAIAQLDAEDATMWHTLGDGVFDELLGLDENGELPYDPQAAAYEPQVQARGSSHAETNVVANVPNDALIDPDTELDEMIHPAGTASCPGSTSRVGPGRIVPGPPTRRLSRGETIRAVVLIVGGGCGGGGGGSGGGGGGGCPRCYGPDCGWIDDDGHPTAYGTCGYKNCPLPCACCPLAYECCGMNCCNPLQDLYCYDAPDPLDSHCCPIGTFGCGDAWCCHPGEICCNGTCGPPGCCELPDDGGCVQTNIGCCVTTIGPIDYDGEFYGSGSTCCNGQCCIPSKPVCCADGHCCHADEGCCGTACYNLATQKCCPPEGENAAVVAGAVVPQVCPKDGNDCCLNVCCADGNECCGGVACCAPPCEVCLNNGYLSGGTVSVSPDPPCTGDTITFTASNVTDHAGLKRLNCANVVIPPVMPTCNWSLTLPPNYPPPLPALTGQGCSINVVAKVPGTYSCEFGAVANRECPPPPLLLGTKTVQTPTVTSVEWIEHAPESTPLDTCPNNGGKRVFPDKTDSNDSFADIRNLVDLRATISPVVQGCTVHFRTFDLDDPFDQRFGCPGPTPDGRPCVLNVSLIDSDTTGPDNRGTDPGVTTDPGTTDANGKAKFTVLMSMQPGNNYRGAASVVSTALSATTQPDADANLPPFFVQFTEMLTVWRKLTLEVDSMARESETAAGRDDGTFEQDRCVVASVTANSPSQGFSTVQCGEDPDPMRAGFAGTSFFEGGAFWCVDGGSQWMIVRSTTGQVGPYALTLWGNPGTSIVGQQCKLRDDDPYFGGGPGQLPITSVVDADTRSAYRDAYIEVVEADPSLNLVNSVPWQSHLSAGDLQSNYITLTGISSQWDLTSMDQFWARHVVMCYQAHRNDAGDGDGDENCAISQNCLASSVSVPYPILGLPGLPNLPHVYGYTWRIDTGYQTALGTIFVEMIRDQWTDATSLARWQVIAHEVGHKTVSLSGSVTAGAHTEGGLMTGQPEAAQLQNIPGNQRFTGPTLVRFRDTRRW